MTKSLIVCLIGIFTLSCTVLGQERAPDRRTWLDENAATTDDPGIFQFPGVSRVPKVRWF